tara:strand:+ start:673 stop:921 length:249 start_codon:yes stop_codon:yes gene_type:complete
MKDEQNKPVSMHDLFDIKMPDDNQETETETAPSDLNISSGPICHTCKMWRPEHLSREEDGFCGKHGFITRATEQCPEHIQNH